jgi:hypothetical protein
MKALLPSVDIDIGDQLCINRGFLLHFSCTVGRQDALHRTTHGQRQTPGGNMKNDQKTLDAAVQYARIQMILRDCRIVHLGAEELARVRLFYNDAGIHPKAHVPLYTTPAPCDSPTGAVPLRATAPAFA